MSRARRPLFWVRVVGVVVALLLGLAIGGFPTGSHDVPLRDRNVASR